MSIKKLIINIHLFVYLDSKNQDIQTNMNTTKESLIELNDMFAQVKANYVRIQEENNKLRAENAELKDELTTMKPRYDELVEFACEHMYNFNSGICPDDWVINKQ